MSDENDHDHGRDDRDHHDHGDAGNGTPGTPGKAPWELTAEEQRDVLALPPRDRYGLFLQIVTDWEEVWGLSAEDGWVLSSGANGEDLLPLWPHPVFARACAHGSWKDSEPSPIPLDELLTDLISILTEDGIRIAVFLSPAGDGVVVSPEELKRDLQAEMELGQ